ncbi:MAG: InlB B-repeat-containing protein [Eubacterium sp.]|nr:InlB B-repeat-containing protein [Eubacterium sp.]
MIRWKDIALRMTVFMMLAVSAVWACHSPADDGRKVYAASKEITVQTHSQDEIRDYVSRHGATLQDGLYFAADPVLEAPYGAGQLSDATKKSALNMLRQIRYIAGISDQIEESGTYSYYAQASSLVNYANGSLSHHPGQPAGMDTELFQAGYEGASKSNLSMYSRSGRSINETIVMSFLNDSDRSNISSVGHRRWLLNPKMKYAGFGAVSGPKGTYCSIYVLDKGNSEASETGVAWPAQNMPVEYFRTDFAWSISLGDLADEEKIHVTLTRMSDQKTWNFSRSSSDGDFYVDNEEYNYSYAKNGCIIFRPPAEEIGSYRDGDVYEVRITGTASPVSYTVRFFQLNEKNHDTGSDTGPQKEENTQKESYVTFVAGGGTLLGSERQRTVMQKLDSFPSAYREGYTFNGWFTAETGGTQITTAQIFSADITLYAQWTENSREFTVTFYANGGICEVSALQTTNQKVTALPVPVRKGYQFKGWFTDPDGGMQITDRQTFAKDMALYAQWTPYDAGNVFTDGNTETEDTKTEDIKTEDTKTEDVKTEYTIVFHANGGTCGTTSLQTSGGKLKHLPVPYRSGYLFQGWYTTPYAGDRMTEATIYEKDSILFAHWTEAGSSFETADDDFESDVQTDEQITAVSVPKVKGVRLRQTRKGKITVTWTRFSGGNGYQIACSTSRAFSKGKTKIKSAGAYDDVKTITGLKKGKTYYVRVRAYQKADGRKYYGNWSKVKKVKIKK